MISVPSPVKNIIDYLKEYQLPVYETADFFIQLINQLEPILEINGSFKLDAPSQEQVNLLADNKYRTDLWNKKK